MVNPQIIQLALDMLEQAQQDERDRFAMTHSSRMNPGRVGVPGPQSPGRIRSRRINGDSDDIQQGSFRLPEYGRFNYRLDGAPAGAVKRPMFFGGTNTDTFNAGDVGNLIRITQKIGSDFYIQKLLFRYASGQDNVVLQGIDVEDNRPFILGNTQLCMMGQVKGAANPLRLPYIDLPGEIVLRTGQSIDFDVTETGVVINPGDIGVILWGYQLAKRVVQ